MGEVIPFPGPEDPRRRERRIGLFADKGGTLGVILRKAEATFENAIEVASRETEAGIEATLDGGYEAVELLPQPEEPA